jgi:hypothetical protein
MTSVVLRRSFSYFAVCWLLVGIGATEIATAQPTNDNFAHRTPILFDNAGISGTLSNATSEAGEPFIDGISSGQTAWWTWTAPTNGILTITSRGTNFNPFVTVYTGNALGELSLVASNNYLPCYVFPDSGTLSWCGCHWRMREEESFHVFRGQDYQICVDSPVVTDSSIVLISTPVVTTNEDGTLQTAYQESLGPAETTNTPPGGAVYLALALTPAPPNDDFDKPVKLAGVRTHIKASNKGATKEPGEPDHDGNPGGSSVWFSWVASASGRVTLSTNEIPPYVPPTEITINGSGSTILGFDCGELTDVNPPPQFYPVLAAYTGTTVNALTSANCLPMDLDAYPNAVEFDAVKGETYHIAFDGNMGTTGDITLFLALTKPAANDTFAKRIHLSGINVAVTGDNAGATHQAGAPTIPGANGKNAWWTWIAPVSGTISIDLTGSDYAFPIGVFTGNVVSNLTLAASGSGSVSFQAIEGVAYQISVADAAGLTGKIKFTLQAPVVELALAQSPVKTGALTMLTYNVSVGQIVLLQSSSNITTWRDIRTATAHKNKINFAVSTGNVAKGISFRAIVVNYNSTF